MGGPNLEVFKFGMYIMFPIGIMYYFGTNLDAKFHTPDFWPKPGQTHTIPFEKDEINGELERLKQRRLAARARRMEIEKSYGVEEEQIESKYPSPILQTLQNTEEARQESDGGKPSGKGWSSWFK